MNYNDQFKIAIIRGMHIEKPIKEKLIQEVRSKKSKELFNKLGKVRKQIGKKGLKEKGDE